jgi:hypothetical protein
MSSNLSLDQGLTVALSSGGWANGTNAGTVQNASTITYVVDGQFYSKSATNNMSIAYTGPSVYQAPTGVGSINGAFAGGGNGSTRLYLLLLNTSGALSVLPGPIVDSADLSAGRVALQFPVVTTPGVCVAGALRIAVTAGTTFTPGTTALNAAGVTATYLNLADVPANPLTA